MVDVSTTIDIHRSRADVAAYATDPDNVTSWYRRIKAVEWKTPKPLEVGSRLAFVAKLLGRRLEYTYEVKEMVAGERFVMATAEGHHEPDGPLPGLGNPPGQPEGPGSAQEAPGGPYPESMTGWVA